ncbi:hypothetical protein Tco_0816426 [Tanacetum coccineum]
MSLCLTVLSTATAFKVRKACLKKAVFPTSGLSIEYHSGLSKPLRSGLTKPLRSGLDLLHEGLPKPLHGGLVIYVSEVYHYKMAEENVPAPIRTDKQLVPVKACLPIGKSNLLMDLQKMQKNPIFRISNTLGKDSKTGVYSFQLDELWFNLNADLLRKALGITPKDFAHPFVPPSAGDLGNYIPWEIRFRRFLDNQLEEGERMWHSIQHRLETDIQKRTRNKAKNDKTEHEMEKCEIKAKKSIKSKSQQKSQTVKVKVNPDKVKVKNKSKSEEI